MSFLMFIYCLAGSAILEHDRERGQESALGIWETADSEAHVEIFEEAGLLYGRLIWIADQPEGSAVDLMDVNNPNPDKRDRPLLGLTIMRDFERTDSNRWENGRIYDPESGREYRSTLRLVGEDVLHIRGYVGLRMFGRTERWIRLE